MPNVFFFFFFQAEDGIRDGRVTGVQTCALPISWAARERAAVFGDLQPVPDCLLRDFRAVFSRPAAGAIGARADRRSYETGRAHAPAGGGGDRPVRPAAGLSALTLRNRVIFAGARVDAAG